VLELFLEVLRMERESRLLSEDCAALVSGTRFKTGPFGIRYTKQA
jgi:hypothetical protein